MTLQRWVGIVISSLSIFTIIANILYFNPLDAIDNYLSIGLAALSLGLFGISIFIEAAILKSFQCVLFFIVSVYAIISETDPVLICVGFFFMIVGFELAILYKFFENHPVPVIIGSLLGMLFFFYLVFHNLVTATAVTAGIAAAFSLLWAMRYYNERKMRRMLKEAIKHGDDMKEALEERIGNGKVE